MLVSKLSIKLPSPVLVNMYFLYNRNQFVVRKEPVWSVVGRINIICTDHWSRRVTLTLNLTLIREVPTLIIISIRRNYSKSKEMAFTVRDRPVTCVEICCTTDRNRLYSFLCRAERFRFCDSDPLSPAKLLSTKLLQILRTHSVVTLLKLLKTTA